MKKLIKYAAYHSPAFKKRNLTLTQERRAALFYSALSTDSEYAQLKTVLLYGPGKELEKIKKPDSVQHLKKINVSQIKKEFSAIKKAFEKENISVVQINPSSFKVTPPANLMYVRDLFWNGSSGAVISRMGSLIRAGEEKYATLALTQLSIPIILGIHHNGLFEGADLLWLNPKTVLCGIGNRTNKEAVKQLENVLAKDKIKIIAIALPKKVQHLLGLIQIIDQKKALVRTSLASKKLLETLSKEKFSIIPILESDEVTHKQGMNIVAIRPNEIFMPKNCPELKKLYQTNGIKILAELEISEVLKGAGGLACITGILSREHCAE